MKTQVKRKKSSKSASRQESKQTTNSLKPDLSEEEIDQQESRFFTILAVTALVILAIFAILQFI